MSSAKSTALATIAEVVPPVLTRLEDCCNRLAVAIQDTEILIWEMGKLMVEVENTPGALDDYGSIRQFMESFIIPKIGGEIGRLYNWLTVAKARIPRTIIKTYGVMIAFEIAKEFPEPGPERTRFIEQIPKDASRRQVQELRAIRDGTALDHKITDAMTIVGTREQITQIRQDIAVMVSDNPGMRDAEAVLMAFAAMSA